MGRQGRDALNGLVRLQDWIKAVCDNRGGDQCMKLLKAMLSQLRDLGLRNEPVGPTVLRRFLGGRLGRLLAKRESVLQLSFIARALPEGGKSI